MTSAAPALPRGPWRRIPRPLRRALVLAGILFGLPAAAWLAADALAASRLSAALASARAEGRATSLAEMAPPPLPLDRNAAASFRAAFDLHPDPRGEDPLLARAAEAGFRAVSGEEERRLVRILEGSSELFARVREGRARGACRYDRDHARPYSRDFPEAAPALRTAALLKLKTEWEACSGRHAEARESVRDLAALAESFKDEPIALPQLVRLALTEVAAEAARSAVEGRLPAPELRAWLEAVPRPETLDGAIHLALRGEFALGAQLAGRPLAEGTRAVDPSQPRTGWLAETRLLGPYWKLVGANHVRFMGRFVDVGAGPYPPARAELERMAAELRDAGRARNLLSLLLVPATVGLLDRQARAQAALAVLREGLAWELERAERGAYPSRPAALDPFTGRPLEFDPAQGRLSSAGLPGETSRDRGGELLSWRLRHPAGD